MDSHTFSNNFASEDSPWTWNWDVFLSASTKMPLAGADSLWKGTPVSAEGIQALTGSDVAAECCRCPLHEQLFPA